MTYDQLMEIGKEKLLTVDTAPEYLPGPLVYVLETSSGNVRTIINDDFRDILDTLAQTKDTAVVKVLAMWKDGGADVPSYAFRKALLALDAANAQTGVLVLTESGYSVRALDTLM